jgi:hypothetical protein
MSKIFKEVFDRTQSDGSKFFEDGVEVSERLHISYGSGSNPALGESIQPEFKGRLRQDEPYFLVGGRHFRLLNWPLGCSPVETATGWEAIYEVEEVL